MTKVTKTTAKTTVQAETMTAIALAEPSAVEMVEMLEAKIKELGDLSADKFKTGTNEFQSIKIKECKDISALVKLAGYVIASRDQYILGQESLGLVTVPEFTIKGCTLEEILGDIKLAINILTHKEKSEKLSELKKEFSELITKDERRKSLLKKAGDLGLTL